MPMKPMRPCTTQGCPDAAMAGGSRCDKHQRAKWSDDTSRMMERPELRESKRFYDSALWKGFRRQKLILEPWCERCKREGRVTLAQLVDHVVPIRQGGERLSLNNAASLCHQCHNSKRAEESRQYG